MWSSTWGEVAPKSSNLKPSFAILEPSWGLVGQIWGHVGPMLQNVADMWCRNGPFRRCWADLCRSANGQITTASVHFLAACSIRECPARAAAPQWAEDCSSRSAPLLNYHASAPSVRADFIQQSSVLSCDCAFLPAKCMSGRLSFCWVI